MSSTNSKAKRDNANKGVTYDSNASGSSSLKYYKRVDNTLKWMTDFSATGLIQIKPALSTPLASLVAFLNKNRNTQRVTQDNVLKCKNQDILLQFASLVAYFLSHRALMNRRTWSEKSVRKDTQWSMMEIQQYLKNNVIFDVYTKQFTKIGHDNIASSFSSSPYYSGAASHQEPSYTRALFG